MSDFFKWNSRYIQNPRNLGGSRFSFCILLILPLLSQTAQIFFPFTASIPPEETMAYQRSPPSPASRRSNHNTRKNDYIPSQRLPKSQSSSPRSSSGDPIPRRFFPNNTSTDLGQKENNQEGCCTPRNTPIRSPALSKGEKNFMSPTISTSSKFTSSPRKNMSIQRNDLFLRTHSSPTLVFSDSTNLDRDNNKLQTSIGSHLSNRDYVVGDTMDLLRSSMTMDNKLDAFFHSQIETCDVNRDDPGMSSFSSASSVVTETDPSSQPYNPKTNYLSPRPRFLHYRPRPRVESYLNDHKSSECGEEEEEEETEVRLSSQEQVTYLDDEDEYNHGSDGADSSPEGVEGISKAFVGDDSTKTQPKRRFPIGLMISSMIMAVLVWTLCFSGMDSPFMTLHASKKEESGYVGEELWMNISKLKPWKNIHKLREDWLIFSNSIFSEVISFVRESGVKETPFSANSTFSNIMASNFAAVNYGGLELGISKETDSNEQNIIIYPDFSDEINTNHVNSPQKYDVSPPLIEYDVIDTVISENLEEEDEAVECDMEDVTSVQPLTFDPPSDYTEENMKKVDTSPAIEKPHDVDFPSLEFDEESELPFVELEEVIQKGGDQSNSDFVKLEKVAMEENEEEKEEEVVVNEGKGETESMDLVTVVSCVAIGAAAAVATVVYKRFRKGGVESGAEMEKMRKKKQKSRRESLSSSSNFTISPSYGSFTIYEKITKKNGEEGAVTTPVRRSNRIRSQITSP